MFVVCSEPQGMCYIETSNLDGETNLKMRQVGQSIYLSKSIYIYNQVSFRIVLGE